MKAIRILMPLFIALYGQCASGYSSEYATPSGPLTSEEEAELLSLIQDFNDEGTANGILTSKTIPFIKPARIDSTPRSDYVDIEENSPDQEGRLEDVGESKGKEPIFKVGDPIPAKIQPTGFQPNNEKVFVIKKQDGFFEYDPKKPFRMQIDKAESIKDKESVAFGVAKHKGYKEALKAWKYIAVQYSDPFAMKQIGLLYKGYFTGVDMDLGKSEKWFKLATETRLAQERRKER